MNELRERRRSGVFCREQVECLLAVAYVDFMCCTRVSASICHVRAIAMRKVKEDES